MKAVWLLMIAGSLAWGQQGSADRVVTAMPVTPHESLAVKLLHPFEPLTGPYTPMSGKERFHQFLDATVSPTQLLREAVASTMSQALASPPEWGGGMLGYGRRFGNDLAETSIRNTITFGVSAALHEDNRYFASGKSGTMRRILHASLSPLEAHHMDGSVGFSYSNAAGLVGASLISRTWAPPSWQGAPNIAGDIGLSFAGQAAFNIFREFLPDILHRKQ